MSWPHSTDTNPQKIFTDISSTIFDGRDTNCNRRPRPRAEQPLPGGTRPHCSNRRRIHDSYRPHRKHGHSGVAAKPIVDCQAVVEDSRGLLENVDHLSTWFDYEISHVPGDRLLLQREDDDGQAYNLHLLPILATSGDETCVFVSVSGRIRKPETDMSLSNEKLRPLIPRISTATMTANRTAYSPFLKKRELTSR